jgi:hypothetical protein
VSVLAVEGCCDVRLELAQRSDDREDVVRERLWAMEQTRPLLGHFGPGIAVRD